MHQTNKGNQWFFGMTAHIGVAADSGLVHTVTATAVVTLFALSNLWMARKQLIAMTGVVRPKAA